MDWQALQDGLKAWIAAALNLSPATMVWAGEAEQHRAYPHVDLRLAAHAGEGMDETRMELLDPDDEASELVPVVYGHRVMTWLVLLKTRDQRAAKRAYAALESVRTQLEAPAAIETFEALGVTVREATTNETSEANSEMRDLSVATLTVKLAYTDKLRDAVHPITPIESVGLSGTVHNGTEVLTIPEHTIPEEAP